MLERLHKVLARAGVASLRAAEDLILEGRVTVNGRVVRELGARVDPDTDAIAVDGQLVEPRQPEDPYVYYLLHKPAGVISTAQDTHGRPIVTGLVPSNERLYPVGRLDADSEGLILLTNDGDLAYRLTHPRFEVEKEYRVLLDRAPTIDDLRRWREGVELEDGLTLPAWVEVLERTGDGAWVRIVMREGRKRQIRNVARLLGYEVRRLIRVREGPLALGDLPAGQWRALTPDEVAALREHTRHVPSRAEDEAREARSMNRDDSKRRLRVIKGPQRAKPAFRPAPTFADANDDERYARHARAYESPATRADADRPPRSTRPDRKNGAAESRAARGESRPPRAHGYESRAARPGDRPPADRARRADSRRDAPNRGGPRRTPDSWRDDRRDDRRESARRGAYDRSSSSMRGEYDRREAPGRRAADRREGAPRRDDRRESARRGAYDRSSSSMRGEYDRREAPGRRAADRREGAPRRDDRRESARPSYNRREPPPRGYDRRADRREPSQGRAYDRSSSSMRDEYNRRDDRRESAQRGAYDRSSSSMRGEYDRRESSQRSDARAPRGRPDARPQRPSRPGDTPRNREGYRRGTPEQQRQAYERRRDEYNRSGGRPGSAGRPGGPSRAGTSNRSAPNRAPANRRSSGPPRRRREEGSDE